LFQDSWEFSTGNLSYYQSFFDPFYKEIFGMDVAQVRKKRSRLMSISRSICSSISSGESEPSTRIPHVTHRVWITNSDSPHEIPAERLETYFNNLGVLKGDDWTHIFWCIDKNKIPKTVEAMEGSGKNIRVRELTEIMPQFRGKSVYERMYREKYYTAISDLVRFNLLHIFGGIYSDFGALFNTDLTPFLDNFDYLFGQEGYLAGTSFVAAQPQSPVYNALLSFIDNMERVPTTYRSWGDHIVTPRWTALGILTLMMDRYTRESDRILPIPYGEDSLVKTNHMGSWLGNTPQFGQVSLQKQPISEAVFFGETSIFDKPYRVDVSVDPMTQFTIDLAQKLYSVDLETLIQNRAAMVAASRQVFFDPKAPALHNIPHITHRSWLTNPLKPSEAPQDKLQMYIDSLRVLTSARDWRHMFWCMNPDQIPETIQFLKASGLPIEIHTLNEIVPKMRGRSIFEAMFKDNRYCNANDITRLNILHLYGGLYADLGFTFHRDLTPLLDIYDRVFLLYDWGNIDHNMAGVRKGDAIIDRHLDSLESLHLLPNNIKEMTPDSSSQMVWTGSHHFMTLLDIFGKNDKTLFLPSDGSYITQVRGETWGKNAKFGNKPIAKSDVDIFSVVQGKIDRSLERRIRVYCPHWSNPYSDYTISMNGTDWTYLGEFLKSETFKKAIPSGQIVSSPLALRKGDIFLLDAGAVLHQWHSQWADSVERELADVDPEASVIVASSTVHTAHSEDEITIHPGTIAFLKKVLERSKTIGVSGETTQRLLEKQGIKTTVVGTGSLLGMVPGERLLEKKDDVKTVAITAVFDSLNPLTQHALLNFGIQNEATYVALSEKEFLKWSAEEVESILERLPGFSGGNWEQQTLFHRFEESQKKEGWFAEKFKEIGISQSYFGKFVDLIKRKVISPKNLKDWLAIAEKHDLVVSSRLEGVIAGLLAGTRSICLAHDSYTEEACKAMSIPYTKWIHPKTSLQELYELADPTLFILNYERYRDNYYRFLKENTVPVTQAPYTLADQLPRVIRERASPVKVFCDRWTYEQYDDFSSYRCTPGDWNTGEYLFANAAKKLFPAYTIARSAKDLKKGDSYLLVVSNVLSPYSGEWAQAELTKLKGVSPDVSVVTVCMGAQSPSLDQDVEIHPTTLSLLKEVAKRSKSIGVRGSYTQKQLQRYGISSRIVGCPSLLFNPLQIESLKQSKDEVTQIAVGATLYSDNPLPQHALFSFAATQGATYIIQTEQEFLEWQKLDSSEAIVERLERLSGDRGSLPYDKKATVLRYLESKPNHVVFQKLKSMGVSASYFKDFAEVVRTKAVLPKNLQDWIQTLKKYDVVVSSRIHGVVAGLLAGTRGLCVAHDSRTLELCQTLKIPHVADFNPLMTAKEVYDLADPTLFIENYDAYKANYLDFLIENVLPTSLL